MRFADVYQLLPEVEKPVSLWEENGRQGTGVCGFLVLEDGNGHIDKNIYMNLND